jgi:predicted permease
MPTGTINDIRYALRGFRRAPLVAFTIVSTVALGLGLVAVAFTIFNTVLFREDRVPGVHEMYAVEGPRTADGDRAGFSRTELESLRRDIGVFTDAYGEMSGIDVRVDGRLLLFTLATGNFFDVVGVKPALGRTLTPDDDQPGRGRTVAVLSDRGWERLFGRDRGVLGRTIQVNGVPFEIVGVMPRDFRGLAIISPDCWAPLATIGHLRASHAGRDASVRVHVIGRLKPGLSRDTALAGLAVWAAGQPGTRGSDRGPSGITLLPWRGTVQQSMDAVAVTGPLFVAFGLILVIGCANVTNLLLARAMSRQREIGIRLSLGAGRHRILRQLLTEGLILALLAAAAGLAMSRIALEVIVNAVLASWPPEIGNVHLIVPDADWRVLLFLLAAAGASTLSFALVPALQATRVEPIAMMRGNVLREARPGRVRGLLVGLQVGVSALLLIAAVVFLRSALAASGDDPGMRTADSVIIGIPKEETRTAMVRAVTADPLVATVAASWPDAIAPPRAAIAQVDGATTRVAYRFVSPEYFGVLDVGVARGRPFAPAERLPDLPLAVLSETAARALWPNGDAIGKTLRLERDPALSPPGVTEPPLAARTVTVIGVARDIAGFRMNPFARGVVYLPGNAAMAGTALTARVHGDPGLARAKLLDRLSAIDPAFGDVVATGSIVRMEAYLLTLVFWMTVALGALALALTVSGLFSVLSYLVEQRTREIGVRRALGATTNDVARLVLRQSLGPVGIGLAVGAGAAAALSALLRSTAGAAPFGGLVQVVDPPAYAAVLLIILAACLAAASIPAARAARVDPMQTLRAD